MKIGLVKERGYLTNWSDFIVLLYFVVGVGAFFIGVLSIKLNRAIAGLVFDGFGVV